MRIPFDFGSLGLSSIPMLAKILLGRRSRGGIDDLGMVETPGVSRNSSSEMDEMKLGMRENKDNMVADEVKRIKKGRERDSMIGKTGEMSVKSQTKAERGWEIEEIRGRRRCDDRRRASNSKRKWVGGVCNRRIRRNRMESEREY